MAASEAWARSRAVVMKCPSLDRTVCMCAIPAPSAVIYQWLAVRRRCGFSFGGQWGGPAMKSQHEVMMEVLRELLRQHGLRFADIAEKLGVTERTVTRWFSADSIETAILQR